MSFDDLCFRLFIKDLLSANILGIENSCTSEAVKSKDFAGEINSIIVKGILNKETGIIPY